MTRQSEQAHTERSLQSAGAGTDPADRLRERLIEGRGRLLVVLATGSVWLLDLLLGHRLERHQVIGMQVQGLVRQLELAGDVMFVIVTLGLILSLYRGHRNRLFRWALVYLLVAMLQVIGNVFGMVVTASTPQDQALTGLWDVAAVYMQSVLVFMFIYIFLDVSTPGGVFVWPSRDGEPPPTPHLIDYLFVALNVNSTFGPTSEALVSRSAKLVMSMQTLLAIVMLTVLIARSAGATT
ncbi:MAG: hypothetical protein VKK98_04730 [Cyanobacteriota bacterium]|nr:hypothetical protein [Cyanobacteriota bacterium]